MKKVKDYNVAECATISGLVRQMKNIGFQATNIGLGADIIRKMKEEKITVFFSFTANMVASGLRSLFARLLEKRFVDVVITTGGAIEHDLIKSFEPYFIGSFDMDDAELHKRNINRIGNILVPSDRYVLLEEKIQLLLKQIYKKRKIINPSELVYEIGNIIKDKNSILYWATKNDIPIFCPGITDSAIGLQTYFFKQDCPDFIIDVTGDMKKLADIVLLSEKTGGIILGGGISKHHVIGANVVRGGLDYAVYITTSQPWDGSLSGARTKEAVSWGKINERAKHITIDGDVTIIFPLIISEVLK